MAKTSVQLKYATSVWPVVEKWVAENNYVLETPGETSRLYFRKSKDESAKISVAISQAGEVVQVNYYRLKVGSLKGRMKFD